MKKITLLFICVCLSVFGFAQTTVTIYSGGGPTYAGTYTTGTAIDTLPAGIYTRNDNVIAVTTNTFSTNQAGYAVFDLSSIPTGAVISSVTLGLNVFGFAPAVYGTCNTYGHTGSLATVTAPSTLYTDCTTAAFGAPVLIASAATVGAPGSFGSGVGDITMNSATVPNLLAFVSNNVSSGTPIVSFSFSGGGTNVYNFRGETGSLAVAGPHAPYLQVTYNGVAPITGPTNVCPGSTIVLSDVTPGGVWSSSNSAVATVSGVGIVSGVSAGTTIISYTVSGSSATTTVTVGPLPAITGSTTVCAGSTTYLSDAAPGGAWSSSNTTIATVSATGIVSGVSAGTATISYTTGCSVGTTVTVSSCTINPITGPTTVCAGSTIALSDATAGGVWSSSNTSVATVSATCVVHGVSAGTTVISYTVSGSSVTTTITVSSCVILPPITGTTTVCVGSTTSLSDATAGGTWGSSNTAIATISATGVVYGITAGTATITYSVFPSIVTTTITVSNTTSPGTISGTSTVYIGGATATLSETVSGGTWSSSNSVVATIDPSTGVYTGVSAGTSIITYTVSGCSGIATTTYLVTVTAINGISGHVNFTGVAYTGNVKVWLITYSTSLLDLEAVDSASISCSGSTSVYYQFPGAITDSYRVKAAVVYSPTVTTGYIPTYHTGSYYWNAANVIYHTSGTADINEDINMLIGTPTSGPGFIAGNVTTGANKGTSTGIPIVGLYVYVFNSTTNQLMQSTITNASGNYSFSNLPVGTYYIFPDSLNYLTTAYTDITLTTGAATMSAANFIQHTISKTITPGTTAMPFITNTPNIEIYPNPTTDELTIKMDKDAYSSFTITNNVGQVLIQQQLNTTQTKVNVKMLPAGLYYITVRGENGSKVQKFVKL